MQIVPYEKIDGYYLSNHPEFIYVHDENLKGDHLLSGDSKGKDDWKYNSRTEANRYGFITYVSRKYKKFYEFSYMDYIELVYPVEEILLIDFIKNHKDKFFLIDPLGYGELNRYLVFDDVIKPNLYEALKPFDNGMLLWDKLDTRYLTNI